MCEAMEKLQLYPRFLSVVGNDQTGQLVASSLSQNCRDFIQVSDKYGTSQSVVVLDNKGDCMFVIGDFTAGSGITPELVNHFYTIE